MAACTHDGLLYGGPDYFVHGDLPCIHHTFTHAKALAAVLDGEAHPEAATRATLPRDEAYGVKSFPEIGTHLASVGDWRATVTEYDFAYVEDVQKGGSSGGGHVSGGALSLLYHRALGPVLVASMTKYEMVEISNQQAFLDKPHEPLTPRIEYVVGKKGDAYTNLNDFEAKVTAAGDVGQASFDATGRLMTAARKAVPGGDVLYRVRYRITEGAVEIVAGVSGASVNEGSLHFVLPVVSRGGEAVQQSGTGVVRITKPRGTLVVHTDADGGFEAVPTERTFNLVPGLECVPLRVAMTPGKDVSIRIETA